MAPAAVPRNHALLIGSNVIHDALRDALQGYGYIVEHCRTRKEGIRCFRERKQSLVVVEVDAVQGSPERLFRFFRMVNANAIVLVAAGPGRPEAARYLLWGAHDVIHIPLHRETLNFTLSRTSAYHRALVRSTFLRTAFWFASAVVPLWVLLFFLWFD